MCAVCGVRYGIVKNETYDCMWLVLFNLSLANPLHNGLPDVCVHVRDEEAMRLRWLYLRDKFRGFAVFHVLSFYVKLYFKMKGLIPLLN